MNFLNLTNQKFTQSFKLVVREERRITAQVLLYFREAEKRMIYAEMGYANLKDFAVKELKYSEAAAYRRINAMRIMRDVPELKDKIEEGTLSLSTVAQASTFIRQTEEQYKEKVTAKEKREILQALEGQSSREAERTLAEINPEIKPAMPEKQKAKANGATEVIMTLDSDLMKQLKEIQVLLNQKMQIKDLLRYLANEQLEILRKKSQRVAKPTSEAQITDTPLANKNLEADGKKARQSVRVTVRRAVMNEARYQCCYVDPLTQRRCQEKHDLQVEHKLPKAWGGGDELENLEALCATHNRLKAVQKFGTEVMQDFMSSLR